MLLKYTTSKVDVFSAHLIDIVDIKVFIIALSTVLLRPNMEIHEQLVMDLLILQHMHYPTENFVKFSFDAK